MTSVTIFCPECDEKMQIVMKMGEGEKGKFISCTKCDFDARYSGGNQEYKKYKHDVATKKR